jgi:hypothetical protein
MQGGCFDRSSRLVAPRRRRSVLSREAEGGEPPGKCESALMVARATTSCQRSEAARLQTSFPTAGTCLVTAAKRDPRPRQMDLLIAAIASSRGLPLYTRNAADFKGLEDLLTVVAI